jgi:hypothetical protein
VNSPENQWISRGIAQTIVASIGRIGAIDQSNAAHQASDTLGLCANEHGAYFDIFDAHANLAMAGRLGQIERRMRDGLAVPVPASVLTNENGLAGRTSGRQLFFLCPRFGSWARQKGEGNCERQEASRRGDDKKLQTLPMERAPHRFRPSCDFGLINMIL